MIGTGDLRYAREFVESDRIPFPVLVDDDARAADAARVERVGLSRLFALGSLPATARALRSGYRIGRPGKRVNQLGATFVVSPGPRRNPPDGEDAAWRPAALPPLRRAPRRPCPHERDPRRATASRARKRERAGPAAAARGHRRLRETRLPHLHAGGPGAGGARQARRAHRLHPGRSRLPAGPRARRRSIAGDVVASRDRSRSDADPCPRRRRVRAHPRLAA